MANLFFFNGSTSDDFDQPSDKRSLLPPCPDSPNCVRLTRSYQYSCATVFDAAQAVLKEMGAIDMEALAEPLRLNVVFRVFIYKDDFIVLVDEGKDSTCHIHLRSASRIGYSDLGVNRRRVKRFLRKLETELEE